MLMTVLSFIIVLGILVFFHELGHYLLARRSGIEVEEFGMGYPPRLVKLFTYDGTDFTLNLLPFGGFARMKGEDAGDMSPGSFNAASRSGRALTLLAGPAMNAILAVLLFGASFMAGFPAVAGYPQLTVVDPDSTAAQLGMLPGDILLSINGDEALVNATPELEYDVLKRDDAGTEPDGLVIYSREGEILSVPFAGEERTSGLLGSSEYAPVLTTQINLTAPDSPAELSGIQGGDIVYAIDDIAISYDNPLNQIVTDRAGQEIAMTVLRQGSWEEITVTPRAEPPPGEGALGVQISPITTLGTLPIPSAMWQGVRSTFDYITLVLQLPVMLIMGTLSPSEAQLSGPVGIAQMVGGAVSATIDTGLWFPILRLSAVLSAALAITNLLPLPALDGGRLLFIFLETIRGRRINPEREGMVHMVGFVLLLGLLVIVTVQDIRTAREGIDWLSLLGQ